MDSTERRSFVVSDGETVHTIELVTSSTPLDPEHWVGWTVRQTNIGWIAIRLHD